MTVDPLLTPVLAFAASLGLLLMSAVVEGALMRRSQGLRRRRGPGLLADAIKLLSCPPPAPRPGRVAGVVAVLLPAVGLAACLPAPAGLGLLTSAGPGAWLLPVALVALLPASYHLCAATVEPDRRRCLGEVTPAWIGAVLALTLCLAAQALGAGAVGSPVDPALAVREVAARGLASWPLWHHPTGAVAAVVALAVLARSAALALGGDRPGLIAGAGAGSLLLFLSRPLTLGALAAWSVHLYLGTSNLPLGVVWAGVLVWLAVVAVVQASLEPLGTRLMRPAWGLAVPLAAIDALHTLLSRLGTLPWA